MKCAECLGSGKVTKGGMIYNECLKCLGSGKLADEAPLFDVDKITIDKKSKWYKSAIKEMRSLHKNIDTEKAEKIFDEEFKKAGKK